MYAKLENGKLKPYRQPIRTGTHDIFTSNPVTLAEYGFYPVRYTVPPEVDEHHVAVPHWVQFTDCIKQVWEVVEVEEGEEKR